MAMLEGEPALTPTLLNQATQAWVEEDYQRHHHSELGASPLDAALAGPSVVRPSPLSTGLRRAFRIQTTRAVRRSDATFTLAGIRFELPWRYRTLTRVTLRVARWDLSSVDLVDPRTGGHLAVITGEPGSSKSVVLRLLADRLRNLRDVVVGMLEHPQSRTTDFYRELSDLFGVPLAHRNRRHGFKALRTRWTEHIGQTLRRPVLIIDEAAIRPRSSRLCASGWPRRCPSTWCRRDWSGWLRCRSPPAARSTAALSRHRRCSRRVSAPAMAGPDAAIERAVAAAWAQALGGEPGEPRRQLLRPRRHLARPRARPEPVARNPRSPHPGGGAVPLSDRANAGGVLARPARRARRGARARSGPPGPAARTQA